jgi:hypothetical protein
MYVYPFHSFSTPLAHNSSDTYFRIFPKDAFQTKLLVSLVFSLEIVQSVCGLVDGFRTFGSHWGDPSELKKIGLNWLSVIGLGAISESSPKFYASLSDILMHSTVALVVQSFYAWRLWMLSRRICLPVAIILVTFSAHVPSLVT